MTRLEKARKIEAILDRIHPLPAVPLSHEDPYTLLVAVVLSAQCTDERVNQVTPALFARARTPAEMAKLRPVIDSFFDKVTVNADNQIVRRNRLCLLTRIRSIMRQVAVWEAIEG